MADVQCENGYTRIANEILEHMAKIKLSPTQYRLLFVIWRFTYGFSRKEHDMSLTFLSNATGCDKRQIQRELKGLEDKCIIHQNIANGKFRKISFNKDYEKWVGESAIGETTIGEIDNGETDNVGETVNGGVGEIVNATIGETVNQERKKENFKENIYTVFNHWKSKGIIAHKKINSQMQSHINARLEEYSLDDLLKAIDNYSKVLTDEMYYWTYRWTLQDFMKPNNVIRFMDRSKPFETFLANGNKKRQKNDVDWEAI